MAHVCPRCGAACVCPEEPPRDGAPPEYGPAIRLGWRLSVLTKRAKPRPDKRGAKPLFDRSI